MRKRREKPKTTHEHLCRGTRGIPRETTRKIEEGDPARTRGKCETRRENMSNLHETLRKRKKISAGALGGIPRETTRKMRRETLPESQENVKKT